MALRLTSPAFTNGASIPREHTCDGADLSPALQWEDVPAQTRSFALIVDDPDAPAGTWVHWVIFDLPATTRQLARGVPGDGQLPSGARQGRNDFKRVGYGGPCPPRGPAHHYHFRLYALDATLGLSAGASRADVDAAMRGHVLAHAELVGVYQRR